MRLLDVKTKTLHTFYGDDIPAYAILSHTWGKEDEEVTYAQIQDLESCRDIAGFRKIELLCHEAMRDGLNYGWCDTCCIDKSSSSELSEAINSMFKWYSCSKVCYVYLVDVEKPKEDAFFSSRWWSRSWTLQELLAPDSVKFFDKDWNFMGDKHELASPISINTGIDERSLSWPGNIPFRSVAQRMSWASQRAATRVEDISYSLLGIFGINMSLQYGEGEMAFIRLQEVILEKGNDQSLFSWGFSPRSIDDLVESRPRAFIINSKRNEHGIYADTPKLFENCQQIKFHHYFASETPIAKANGALHMEMPLVPLVSLTKTIKSDNPERYKVGILPCSHKEFPHRMMGVLLENWSTSRGSRFRRCVLGGVISTFLLDSTGLATVGQVLIDDRLRVELAKMDHNRGISHVTIMLRGFDMQSRGFSPLAVIPPSWKWDPKTLTLCQQCLNAPKITTIGFFSETHKILISTTLILEQIETKHTKTPVTCAAGTRRTSAGNATKNALLNSAHDNYPKETAFQFDSRSYSPKQIFHHFIFEIEIVD